MWLMNILGVKPVRAALARLAASFSALADDVEAERLRLRGVKPPPAIGGPAPEGNGRKKAKAKAVAP